MDESDIRYILALTKREVLLNELETTVSYLSAMTSRLMSLRRSTRMLEMDLQIPESDSSSFHLMQAEDWLSLGKVHIEKSLDGFYGRATLSAATTSGSLTTKSSKPADSANPSTSVHEE